MPQWVTVYDIRQEPAPVGNEVRGGIAGSLVLLLLLALVWKRRERAPKLFLLACLAAWAGFSIANGVTIARSHREAQQALARGSVETVEGEVQDFSPAGAEGGLETFRIGDRTFLVSDGETKQPGLARTSARGGPVRRGAWLRIASRGRSILRVQDRR